VRSGPADWPPLLARLPVAVVAVAPGAVGAVALWPIATLGVVPGATAAGAAGRWGPRRCHGAGAAGGGVCLAGLGLCPERVNNPGCGGHRVRKAGCWERSAAGLAGAGPGEGLLSQFRCALVPQD